MLWLLPVIVLLLSMAALLSASETALFSLTRMESAREQLGGNVARAVERMLRRPLESLITIIGCTEALSVFTECLVTSLLLYLASERGAYLAVPINLVLILLLTDITPKTLALGFPAAVMRITGRPLAALTRLLHPITHYFSPEHPTALEPLSETEFKALIRASVQEGQIEPAERDLIYRVFDLGGRRASDIMSPRERIFAIPIDTPPEQLGGEVARGHFSRVPIYRGDLDHVVGILHVKELVRRRLEMAPTRIERLLRPPFFIPPSKPLGELLDEMRRDRAQIALVVNEFGKLLGLVTLEDLLEELFGEIQDEFDSEGPEISALGEGRWSVSGSTEVRRLAEVAPSPGLFSGESNETTLNRLILRRLGRVPREGERFTLMGVEVIVNKVRGASIERVTMRRGAQ